MAALTAERDTKQYEIDHVGWLPVAAGVKIWAGSLVASNAAGYAVPASADNTLTCAGRAEHSVDNSAGASGDKKLTVRRGIFRYANSAAGDAITVADRYKQVYAQDDQTVAKTNNSGARPRAGMVVNVEPAGVWVNVNPLMGT
jgi:CCR4-NOT transcriptional regulation complex NOT5 subunit